MNAFKRYYCIILALFVAYSSLNAQTLKLVRTDVDSTRFSFVTSTYLFGFDVYIEDIDSCTGVSFDLNYTYADFIKFSEARPTDFGIGGKQPVIITRTNTGENTGYVYCGVLTGDTVGSRGFDNPKVIHLEFAVTQNATHGVSTIFSFSNIQAVVSTGTTGRIIQLTAEPIAFDIHGFINVWPGDANNDGTVDTKDVTTIGRFMGYGSSSKTDMRSFKRPNASTLWAAQPVLAWDSIDVAHADCDGNGDVTVTDQLIVALNFGKTHTYATKISNKIEGNTIINDIPLNAKRIPIIIKSYTPIVGSACRINFTNLPTNTKILGITKGDLYSGNAEFYSNFSTEQNYSDISLISTETSQEEKASGTLCYIYYEGDEISKDNFQIESLYGAVKNSYIIPISGYLSAEDELLNNEILRITTANGNAKLTNLSEFYTNINIYNYTGSKIEALGLEISGEKSINLPTGFYIIRAESGKLINNYKLIIK